MVAQPVDSARILTILGTTAPIIAWQAALERARSEGVNVFASAQGWYATSVNQPGRIHHVNGACDREAAAHGKLCKHLATVRGALFAFHRLEQCSYYGRVAPITELTRGDRWLGGLGHRE